MVKEFTQALLFTIVCLVCIMWVSWPDAKNNVAVKYDCRMLIGGWHPDVPVAVQEECRKRSNK